MTRWKMDALKKALVLTAVVYFVFLPLARPLLPLNEVAHIKLQVGGDGYVRLNIPQKYIGPSLLDLSRQVLDSSAPVKMIPLSFIYPGFKPVKRGWRRMFMSLEEERDEVNLFLTGGRGEKLGYNGTVYWRLSFDRPEQKCHGEPYPEKEHGLFRYKRFYDCLTEHPYHAEDMYFYDAPGDSEQDVMIQCPTPQHTGLCRFYVNVDDLGLVSANFTAEHSLLTSWQQVVADYTNFITPFYTNEIQNMKRPTPMSAEVKREIGKSVNERWKP